MRIDIPRFIIWLVNQKEKAKINEVMAGKKEWYWDAQHFQSRAGVYEEIIAVINNPAEVDWLEVE